jgi:hypothetical protein
VTIAVDSFLFGVGTLGQTPGAEFIAHIRAGIADRETLFSVLSAELNFPDYFGRNWDALFDCLTDLSWIAAPCVVLVHEDIPALPDDGLTVYLEILSDAARDENRVDSRRLIVVFPVAARNRIDALSRR